MPSRVAADMPSGRLADRSSSEPPLCQERGCHSPAVVVLPNGTLLCATAALEWLAKQRAT